MQLDEERVAIAIEMLKKYVCCGNKGNYLNLKENNLTEEEESLLLDCFS